MITHNEAIAQLADRVIHLEDGRIVRDDGEAYIRENEQGQVAGIGQSASGKEASL